MNALFRPFALCFTLSPALAVPLLAAPLALCENGECQPVISQVRYFDRDAYRLSDGKTEAIVVPAIGRIMSYKKVGGENVLFNATSTKAADNGWSNFGGDKTWMSPQSFWKVMHGGNGWPPDTAFDGQPYQAQVLTGGKLEITSPLSQIGIRVTRTIYFASNGELVIEQTAKKVSGQPVRAGIWSIAQIVPGDAIYLPTNATSPYKNNFYWFGNPAQAKSQKVEAISSTLLKWVPAAADGGIKIGIDSPVAAIASVRGNTTFLLKTAKPDGQYPDGSDGAGFPVELYVNGDSKIFYCELELLAPLQNFFVGMQSTHTMRWSLHDETSPAAIEALLLAPPSVERK